MARDLYHQLVREALVKEGWTVTHDPYSLSKKIVGAKLEIDLGLEKIIIAEKDTQKIAVEVKSFIEDSLIYEFHSVAGQYFNYLIGLELIEPDRQLFLAMPEEAYLELSKIEIFKLSVQKMNMKIITFDLETSAITLWKK